MKGKRKINLILSLAFTALLLFAAAASSVTAQQTTTSCGTCRNPNDAQDRSYCDPVTNQCVRQTQECAPFFVNEKGNQNLCQPLQGRDPNTGECLYQNKFCAPTGCLEQECNPSTGQCEVVPVTNECPFNEACDSTNCPADQCGAFYCQPFASANCDLLTSRDCSPVGSCRVATGCDLNAGCTTAPVSCAPPANLCEELMRDPNAAGCCTLKPRNCAAEYGNNPNFTYSCDPTATNGVCQATPKPVPDVCDGVDNNNNGQVDENFLNTDGDSMADCVDPDDDNDTVPDVADNCTLIANPNQADFDRDGKGDACDPLTGPPGDIEQCKNNGFRRFDSPRTFRNQGECVSFVERHGP